MVPNVVHWAPIHINNIQNPEGLGAMMALDALLLIPDRHERNILIQDTGRRTSRVWAIDHGQALISQAGKSPDVQGAINEPHALARGIPVDLVGPSAMRTAIRASKIRESTLRAAVRAAGRFAGEKQTSAIENCVIFRCQQAEMLVAGYLETVRRRR